MYRIDTEFKSFLPPLAAEEFAALEADIRQARKVREPLTIWIAKQGKTPILIDGHHRHAIIEKLKAEGIEVAVPAPDVRCFADRFAALSWMLSNQNARRNMTPAQRAAAVLANKSLLQRLTEEASRRMLRGKEDPGRRACQGREGRVNAQIAAFAHCSEDTVTIVRLAESHPAIHRDLVAPASESHTLSVRQARFLLKHEMKERWVQEAQEIELPQLDSRNAGQLDVIYLADALNGLDLIANDSVQLTITSPPYFLSDVIYENAAANFAGYDDRLHFLGKAFGKVFRKTVSGGRCVINIDSNNNRDPSKPDRVHNVYADISQVMASIGWRFYGEICWFKQNSVGRRSSKFGSDWSPSQPNIRRQHEYLLIFFKDQPHLASPTGDRRLIDLSEDESRCFSMSQWYIKPAPRLPENHRFYHPAVFPEEIPYRLCKLLSYVGNTILDPFVGTGTVPFVARALQRHYLGIDNGPTYVEYAQRRLATLDGQSPAQMRAMIQRFTVPAELRNDGWGLRPSFKSKPEVEAA
jgi:site-specific DNA-methyltransferase (adenine-specific)